MWVNAGAVIDAAGNKNEDSNTARIGVGLTDLTADPPRTRTDEPIIVSPPANSIVGQKIALTGTANFEDDLGDEIVVTSGPVHASAQTNGDGSWIAVLDISRLPDGQDFTVSVQATRDVAGSSKAPSTLATRTFTRKSTVPVISAEWPTNLRGDTLGLFEGISTQVILQLTSSLPAPTGGLDVTVQIELPEQYFSQAVRDAVPTMVKIPEGTTQLALEPFVLLEDNRSYDGQQKLKAQIVASAGAEYALSSGRQSLSGALVESYISETTVEDFDHGVYFVAQDMAVDEVAGGTTLTFTVEQLFSIDSVSGTLLVDAPRSGIDTRTIGSGVPWTIGYRFIDDDPVTRSSAVNGSDYTGMDGTLTFAANPTGFADADKTVRLRRSATISVDILDDLLGEAAETFEVELFNPGQTHGGTPNFRKDLTGTNGYTPASGTGSPFRVTGTINLNDGGPVSEKPVLALQDATSDTGASASDGITMNTTPVFKVTNAVGKASLQVTATRPRIASDAADVATFEVSKPVYTVPDTPTTGGELFNFAQSDCTTTVTDTAGVKATPATNQPCTLADLGDLTWTVTATQTETGTPPIPATDSDPFTLDVDTTAPTVAVSIDDDLTSIEVGETANVRFTFSEPIAADTFEKADLAVTPDNVTAAEPVVASDDPDPTNPTIYTIEVTGATSGGSDSFSVAANKFEDLAGNPNTAASTPSPAPTLAVTVATSSVPTVDLAAASDTGSSNTDNRTKATDLSFEIGNVAAGATLKVTASRQATFPAMGVEEVSQTVTVDAGNTSGTETVVFTGSSPDTNCTDADGAAVSCLLDEGNAWKVIATHTDGSKPESSTPDADALELIIDQTAPTVTLSAGSIAVAQGGDPGAVTLTFNEAIGSFPDDAIVAPNNTYVTLAAPAPDPSDPKIYTLGITGKLATPAGSPVILELASGKVADLAGNAAAGSASFVTVTVNAPLAAPTVDLDTASDSGPDDEGAAGHASRSNADNTDNITNDNTPSFTVTLPAEATGASVTVTATHDPDSNPTTDNNETVTRTVTGVTGTTATVLFSGSGCDSEDAGEVADESCTLGDGVWSVTATWNDGTQDSPVSPVLGDSTDPALRKLLLIDTVAPTVAAFADNQRLAAAGDTTTLRFVVSEGNLVGLEAGAADTGDLFVSGNAGSVEAAAAFTVGSEPNSYEAVFTAGTPGMAGGTSGVRMRAGLFHDAAGNPNVLSNVVRVSVGRTETAEITATPTIISPTAGDRVGARLGLIGRAEPQAQIDITAGTVGVTAISLADGEGYWSVDLAGNDALDISRLADGPFTVLVRATARGKATSDAAEVSLVKGHHRAGGVGALGCRQL